MAGRGGCVSGCATKGLGESGPREGRRGGGRRRDDDDGDDEAEGDGDDDDDDGASSGTAATAAGAGGGGGGAGGGGAGAAAGAGGRRLTLTQQHLYVAYVWYLNQREHDEANRGYSCGAGEEEHFCLKCKDGGDMMLCDFRDGACSKSFHPRCCGLKAVPEGLWECPRHRCIRCGVGPARTDAQGRPRTPDPPSAETTLWPCRTCPKTFCTRCLEADATHVGSEIVCSSCLDLLDCDASQLQQDLLRWNPDQFAAAAASDPGQRRRAVRRKTAAPAPAPGARPPSA